MIIKDGLTFDDVLLIPQHSTIKSRSEVDVSIKWAGLQFDHPIIPANMKTITGRDMAIEIIKSGGLAILHRFMSNIEQLEIAEDIIDNFGDRNFALSIGVKEEDRPQINNFIEAGVKMFCIDVAHGDSEQCLNMIKWIKHIYPDVFLITGNVATGQGAKRLWEAGANVVKVGIGPGCFGAGTRVLMSNGFYKNIEDIKTGDFIINKNGVSVKVLNAFSTGTRKVSKLKNNSFYTDTYVTPDHQFWVGDLSSTSKNTLDSRGYARILKRQSNTIPRQSKFKWKSISDAQNDALLFPKNISFQMPETFKISLNKRIAGNYKIGHAYSEDAIITPNYDSGYLFGTFLGDG